MRKLSVITLVVCMAFLASPLMAGPGHGHEEGHDHGPISSDQAGAKAIKKVSQLVKKGKIDASWQGVNPSSIEKKTFSKEPEWVIVFKNDKVNDPSKQTLYLFYTLDGHYLAANYSGN